MGETADRRAKIQEQVYDLIREYADTWVEEGAIPPGTVTAFYVVADFLYPTGSRNILEFGDAQSSRYTAMGMLFAALHDPRWLPVVERKDD